MVETPPASVALVFAGGDPVDAAIAARLPDAGFTVAADSGVEHALALGRDIDLVVGDFDSADPAAVDAAVAGGAEVRRYPAEKDQSDLELAVRAARDGGATHVIVVGGSGGRLDHLLANALLLASPSFDDIDIEALLDDTRITVIHRDARLRARQATCARCSPPEVPPAEYGRRACGIRSTTKTSCPDPPAG